MLVVINNGGELSLKAKFIIQLLGLDSKDRILYVFKKEDMFKEKWDHNQVELATSISGIMAYFFLMMVKSPKDLKDGVLRRLINRKSESGLFKEHNLLFK